MTPGLFLCARGDHEEESVARPGMKRWIPRQTLRETLRHAVEEFRK
jgi:hypothetical protein